MPGHEPTELLDELAASLPDDTALEVVRPNPAGAHRCSGTWLMVRWPFFTWRQNAPEHGRPTDDHEVRISPGEKAALPVDERQPLATLLTSRDFPADHARGVEGTLLLLLDDADATRHAKKLRANLPLEAKAILESMPSASLTEKDEWLKAARHLEKVGDRDVNHVFLWLQALSYLLILEGVGIDLVEHRLHLAGKAVAADPQNPSALANLGVVHLQLEDPHGGTAPSEGARAVLAPRGTPVAA